MRAENLSLSWKLASGDELTGSDIGITRDATGTKLTCGKCAARHKQVAVESTSAQLELTPENVPRRLDASTLVISQVLVPPARPQPAAVTPVEPVPPPLPVIQPKRHRRESNTTKHTPEPEPDNERRPQ